MAKVDALIRWFMPKEERFHELFDRDTANLVRATRYFIEFARLADLETRRAKMVELRACEHEGDTITRQIFDALNSSFITPFDREDIRSLATDLDDVLDFVEGVAQQLVNFELGDSPEGLRQFADILVEMATEIDAHYRADLEPLQRAADPGGASCGSPTWRTGPTCSTTR